jgi:hypothetical protein
MSFIMFSSASSILQYGGIGRLGTVLSDDGKVRCYPFFESGNERQILIPHLLIREDVMDKRFVVTVPVLPVEVQNPFIVLNLIFISGRTLCNQAVIVKPYKTCGIEGNIGSKSHAKRCRKLMELLDIFQKRGQIPGFPFGSGIQRNAHELVVYTGIVKAVCDSRRKIFAIFLVQRKDGNDLIEEELIHESVNRLVMHAVPDDIKTGQIGAKDKSGMSAV